MKFTLPTLPYSYDALAPYIDAKTMEIHHTKHHAAYINKLNDAYNGDQPIEEILKNIGHFSAAIRNNGGGHFNHSLFWTILTPDSSEEKMSSHLKKAITSDIGSLETLKEKFSQAATNRFGSGWAWVCVNKNKKICVCSSANQDNPLMETSQCPGTPILGLDVWEHAYYLNYLNRRPDYINAFWKIIHWEEVSKRYEKAIR